MASDLNTLLDRLRSQVQEFHDGAPQDPTEVTDGSLIADHVVANLHSAALGQIGIEEALGVSTGYTDFDLEGFMSTYPDTFAQLYDDLG